jgi:hypothetical protein
MDVVSIEVPATQVSAARKVFELPYAPLRIIRTG